MHHIMEEHATGIQFREWLGGLSIDQHMSENGFFIELSMDLETGFILGGNSSNCLTWMDKMGSSKKACNKGVPSTPRDGSPIEMVALLYKALLFL